MVLFFPDNTVMVNFAILDHIDLLERLANGNGRWTAAVAEECRRSAQISGLGALTRMGAIFGSPILPDAADMVDTFTIREGLLKPGDSSTAHLGEAETLAVIGRRSLTSAVFVTDDRDALALAEHRGVRIADTWDLLVLAEKAGFLTSEERAIQEVLLSRHGRRRPRRSG